MSSYTYFEIDWFAFFLAIGLLIAFFFLRYLNSNIALPSIYFSSLELLKKSENRKTLFDFENLFKYLSFLFFIIAFIDPHLLTEKSSSPDDVNPEEGVALYLVVDRSGSMRENIQTYSNNLLINTSKEALVKQVTRNFISNRTNDLIGLIAFARTAEILSPLTLNHEYVLQQLDSISPVKNRNEDGTSIGYALYKTINLIKATKHYTSGLSDNQIPSYKINGAAIVLITDGLQQPNPLDQNNPIRNIDLVEAGLYAKENKIHLYLINIDPKIGLDEFAPQRNQMESTTAQTGGGFYLLNENTNLSEIFEKINQLEKSKIFTDTTDKNLVYSRVSFFPWLIALGLLFLFLAIIQETFISRKVP